jgi:hypothetical protein
MTGPKRLRGDALERQLTAIAARGHQAVFRFYVDYPGKPSSILRYLLDQGLITHPYDEFGNNGGSVAPDYSDPRLVAAFETVIAALGRRYDGDPRSASGASGTPGRTTSGPSGRTGCPAPRSSPAS